MTRPTADEWRGMTDRKLLLFGMSGLGKTHVSNMLRASGGWFHYSIDYRIGTRYMGDHIVDNFKREAMRNPFLRDLLLSDSIYIASNITFDNLAPLSTYLGKPGNPDLGGLPFSEYLRRQEQHRAAEIASLLDTPHFIERAADIYNYHSFVCDSGGSICEVVDPNDPEDPVLTTLSDTTLMVWIRGTPDHTAELVRRFDRAPKPMYYEPGFLKAKWAQYLAENDVAEAEVDPDAFVRWTYAQALDHRQPRYAAMAQHWGVTVDASDVALVADAEGFIELVAQSLEKG
ncbi:ATPase [Meridianimarinicoccus roseus]|uniref:ATPase n=1 Tax=Meridianimarinicoccus roseus TaxID=2072018 RepID=A0A2V2LCB1_9RHOB|nr:ATPase [Meridianimarinicoccus roseus]PWR02965.1 ATPase [Meridianimarinicoccus roseus]